MSMCLFADPLSLKILTSRHIAFEMPIFWSVETLHHEMHQQVVSTIDLGHGKCSCPLASSDVNWALVVVFVVVLLAMVVAVVVLWLLVLWLVALLSKSNCKPKLHEIVQPLLSIWNWQRAVTSVLLLVVVCDQRIYSVITVGLQQPWSCIICSVRRMNMCNPTHT